VCKWSKLLSVNVKQNVENWLIVETCTRKRDLKKYCSKCVARVQFCSRFSEAMITNVFYRRDMILLKKPYKYSIETGWQMISEWYTRCYDMIYKCAVNATRVIGPIFYLGAINSEWFIGQFVHQFLKIS
jgi:hypothetical protein